MFGGTNVCSGGLSGNDLRSLPVPRNDLVRGPNYVESKSSGYRTDRDDAEVGIVVARRALASHIEESLAPAFVVEALMLPSVHQQIVQQTLPVVDESLHFRRPDSREVGRGVCAVHPRRNETLGKLLNFINALGRAVALRFLLLPHDVRDTLLPRGPSILCFRGIFSL